MNFFETSVTVRYAETDAMGIVHHSNYPVWLEIGRTHLTKELGMPYAKMEEMGALLPLISLQCKFLSPARYDDEILIRTAIKEMSQVRLTFSYLVYRKKDEKLLLEADTQHVWTNRALLPMNLKKAFPLIFETFISFISHK